MRDHVTSVPNSGKSKTRSSSSSGCVMFEVAACSITLRIRCPPLVRDIDLESEIVREPFIAEEVADRVDVAIVDHSSERHLGRGQKFEEVRFHCSNVIILIIRTSTSL